MSAMLLEARDISLGYPGEGGWRSSTCSWGAARW